MRLYTLSVSLFRGVASQVTRGTHREQPFGVPLPGRSALPRPRASRVAKWHFHVQVPRYLPALRGAFPPATVPCAHCPAGTRGKARVRRLPTRLLRPRATPAPAGAPRPRRRGPGGAPALLRGPAAPRHTHAHTQAPRRKRSGAGSGQRRAGADAAGPCGLRGPVVARCRASVASRAQLWPAALEDLPRERPRGGPRLPAWPAGAEREARAGDFRATRRRKAAEERAGNLRGVRGRAA